MAAPENTAPSPSGPTFPVHGIVRNALTGSPLARVLVSIPGDHDNGTLTDGEGRFTLPAVPSGPIPFTLLRPGFLDPAASVTPENDSNFNAERQVNVSEGMAELVFELAPQAVVQGHIELSTGDVAEDVTVHLYQRQVEDGRTRWHSIRQQKSDCEGNYRFAGLPAGTYTVSTDPQMETEELTSQVSPAAGNDLERYGFAGLYYPEASDLSLAQKLPLLPGDTATANLSLTLLPLHTVLAGVVLPKEQGKNVTVNATIQDSAGHALPWDASFQAEGKQMQTALPDGSYVLALSALEMAARSQFEGANSQARNSKQRLWLGSQEFSVSGHDLQLTPITLHEAPETQVILHLLPSANTDHANQAILVATPAELASGQTNETILTWPIQAETSNSIPLPPGDYWMSTMSINQSGSTLCEDSLTANGKSLARTPLHVERNGAASVLEVTMRQDCATLTLALPTEISEQLSGQDAVYTAWVVPQFDTTLSIPPMLLRASSGGRNTLSSLPPGRYRVYLSSRSDSLEYRNPEALAQAHLSPQEFTLEPSGSATITLEVPAP